MEAPTGTQCPDCLADIRVRAALDMYRLFVNLKIDGSAATALDQMQKLVAEIHPPGGEHVGRGPSAQPARGPTARPQKTSGAGPVRRRPNPIPDAVPPREAAAPRFARRISNPLPMIVDAPSPAFYETRGAQQQQHYGMTADHSISPTARSPRTPLGLDPWPRAPRIEFSATPEAYRYMFPPIAEQRPHFPPPPGDQMFSPTGPPHMGYSPPSMNESPGYLPAATPGPFYPSTPGTFYSAESSRSPSWPSSSYSAETSPWTTSASPAHSPHLSYHDTPATNDTDPHALEHERGWACTTCRGRL